MGVYNTFKPSLMKFSTASLTLNWQFGLYVSGSQWREARILNIAFRLDTANDRLLILYGTGDMGGPHYASAA